MRWSWTRTANAIERVSQIASLTVLHVSDCFTSKNRIWFESTRMLCCDESDALATISHPGSSILRTNWAVSWNEAVAHASMLLCDCFCFLISVWHLTAYIYRPAPFVWIHSIYFHTDWAKIMCDAQRNRRHTYGIFSNYATRQSILTWNWSELPHNNLALNKTWKIQFVSSFVWFSITSSGRMIITSMAIT